MLPEVHAWSEGPKQISRTMLYGKHHGRQFLCARFHVNFDVHDLLRYGRIGVLDLM